MDQNEISFKTIFLYLSMMKNMEKSVFVKEIEELSQLYDIENLDSEARTWFNL